MHSLSRILLHRSNSVLNSPTFLVAVRQTSAGPPPATPAKEGSLTYKYEQFIGKWPKVLALHRTVLEGSRWCFADVKMYFKTKRAVATGQKKLTDLSVEELETLVQMPVEGPKMAIVTAFLPVPLSVYVFAFAIIFFPRLVLTRHFWSDQQRREYFQLEVTKALISGEQLLKTYGNPSSTDENKMKPLDKLDSSEMLLVHNMQSMYPIPGSSKRIMNRMKALRALDNLLPTTIDGFNERQLIFNCYIRKIDIGKKNDSEMRDSLRQYVKFTSRMPNNVYLYASPLFKQK
ncbi:Letm1 RBD domain-containing protein [Caenorhabditis elegans]|uniref:Letm1 RBD domain-containing protein n=1 Tax=Caenorhabditis elegans TaxID=6239 RepID=Q95QI1_CAEEL|nr:Letm1 RBD domain-containing protein [Caenorhabditis elegans]CAC42296.1 Letm1 RBD domain-containing protein [Caenorhabditis elegans]|eukprot:NP_492165.1 Uncharacterized protein CELE_F30F8.9 [Caenorhabditis elegans]